MSDRAIFFDPTRRRWSWFKRFGTLAGLAAAVAMSVWLVSFLVAPDLPGFDGIARPIGRKARAMIPLPSHQERLKQYRLEKTRKQLLTALAQDHRQRLARAARPPIQTSNIVAAFYAPWEETGLYALNANAQYMTHLLPVWFHPAPDDAHTDKHDFDALLWPTNPAA